jgi:SnoaL-like domain
MDDVPAVVRRLQSAMNEHDPASVAACFAEEYRNETPVHPARGFTGRQQVHRNWTQILGAVPDLTAVLVRWATAPDTVWAEWDWSGNRASGGDLRMRGITVLGLDADRDVVQWARFYMEPVDDDPADVAATVRDTVGSAP